MRSKNKPQEATYESAWKLIQENAKAIREMKKERQKEMEERKKEMEERKKEVEERKKEMEERRKEMERRRKEREEREKKREEREKEKEKSERERNKQREEREKQREKREKERNKQREESERERKIRSEEFDRKFAQLEKAIENTNKQIGGISRSNGEFCEEYFINSFKENPTFMGEKYDYVVEYLRPYPNTVIPDEYDLVLHNGSTVVIIEMKYKASIEDVGKMFSKLHSYRANYPMNKDYKIYLALASFRFPEKVRKRADEEGIVLIEQRGDKIEVISENVKTW